MQQAARITMKTVMAVQMIGMVMSLGDCGKCGSNHTSYPQHLVACYFMHVARGSKIKTHRVRNIKVQWP